MVDLKTKIYLHEGCSKVRLRRRSFVLHKRGRGWRISSAGGASTTVAPSSRISAWLAATRASSALDKQIARGRGVNLNSKRCLHHGCNKLVSFVVDGHDKGF